MPHTPTAPVYNPNPTRASRSRGKATDDRAGADSDPGGTPVQSDADEEGHAVCYSKLLSNEFGHASCYYTCSSISDVYVTSDNAVGPIPIPKTAKAALKDKIYASQWKLAMQTEVKGKYLTNHAWRYVTKIPAGRKVMKGK